MNLRVVLVCTLFCSCIFLYSQPNPNKKHSLFVEIGGLAPDYSANYRRELDSLGNSRLGFRIGVSVTNDTYALPFGIELISSNAPHHFQLVFGFTPFIVDYSKVSGSIREDTDGFGDVILGAGYRYDPESQKWFVTLLALPKLRLDPAESNFFELSPDLRIAFGFGVGMYL